MKTQIVLSVLLLACMIMAQVEGFQPENYREVELHAVRLNQPLKIDGKLKESLYLSTPCSVFIQQDPDNGRLSSEKTEAWIGYDDEALYVGAHLWDSRPDSIVGRKARRDSDSNSDMFQVAIDSYHDKRSGFFFTVNPVGAIGDGTISNDSWFDDTWDGIWYVATDRDHTGWYVEMKIPYSQLRFNKQNGEYVWGLAFGRIIQRKNERCFNFYLPRGESGAASHFPTLRGLKGIQPPKRIEGIPYITSGYSHLPSEKDNPFFKGEDKYLNTGMDIKIGLGSNITIDATFNPDFGQVEVDPSVINLSDYETYYEEKRPFFIEGSSIFSFGRGGPTNRWGFNFSEPSFFYSRRIGRPPQRYPDTDGWVDSPSATSIIGAAKISGKLGGDWAIGGLSALTAQEFATIKEDGDIRHEKVEPLTSYNLIRTQKEFNKGNQGIGIIATHLHRFFNDFSWKDGFGNEKGEDDRELENLLSSNSSAFGVDGWTFFNKKKEWVISGWLGFSNVQGTKDRILSLQENSSHYFQRPDQEHVSVDSNLTSLSGYAGRFILNKEKGHVIFNTALGIISPGFECNDMGLNFRSDRINKHIVVGYRWYDPGKIFRFSAINLAYVNNHNFNGIKNSEMVFLFGFARFLNYWSINGFTGWGPRTLDDTNLRGGPMVISPSGYFGSFGISSDDRKDVIGDFSMSFEKAEKGTRSYSISSEINIKAGSSFDFSIEPGYSVSRNIDQYVESIEDPTAELFYGTRYIFAQIDQKTLSMDIRVNWTFTPTLSIQSFFQPFISVGKYSNFKEFRRPKSYDFFIYGEEGSIIAEEDGYYLDPTGGDNADAFWIDKPDFNYKAIVGNVVLRWEFSPGSNLYLVWTRNGSKYLNTGEFRFTRDLRKLIKASTDDVFAIKIAYWFG